MLTQHLAAADLDADAEWDEVVEAAGGRLAQTVAWARVKTATDWRAERVGVRRNGSIVAGAQILTRRLPMLGRLGYLDGGPVVVDPAAVEPVADAIVAFCKRARLRNLVVDLPEGSETMVGPLRTRGFVPSQVKTALAATGTPGSCPGSGG